MKYRELTQKYLKSIFYYDEFTGYFTRKVARRGVIVGEKAGTNTLYGYIRIKINDQCFMAHRLVWLYVFGRFPKEQIDHINHIPSDNRLLNLRECSRSQNQANTKTPKNNKSGYKGVCWHITRKKWCAQISIDSKNRHIGYYENKTDAAKAYNIKAKQVFGEFAFLNDISL